MDIEHASSREKKTIALYAATSTVLRIEDFLERYENFDVSVLLYGVMNNSPTAFSLCRIILLLSCPNPQTAGRRVNVADVKLSVG